MFLKYLLFATAISWAWIPNAGNLAYNQSAHAFPITVTQSEWQLAAGGSIPMNAPTMSLAFVEVERLGTLARMKTQIAQESMDSLYRAQRWGASSTVQRQPVFASAQVEGSHHFISGSKTIWEQEYRGHLGLYHAQAWAVSSGLRRFQGCIFPEFAIQWSLGDTYQMELTIHKATPKSWTLGFNQELSSSSGLRAQLGWLYPAQQFAVGLLWPLSPFQAEVAQYWHPELNTERFGSMMFSTRKSQHD